MTDYKLWVCSDDDEVVRADRVVGLHSAAPDFEQPDRWVVRAEVLHGSGTRVVDLCRGHGDNFRDFAPSAVAKAIAQHHDRAGLLGVEVERGKVVPSSRSTPGGQTTLDKLTVTFEAWDSQQPDSTNTTHP
ncbi:MAG: hypothetical protein HOV94_40340 [Saccharothrix sp.]|nr:hypothetical protein [Saccharothrix sp.]